jgi:hypothetical protein
MRALTSSVNYFIDELIAERTRRREGLVGAYGSLEVCF